MSPFLLQQVLGNDWNQLPRVLQRHYQVNEKQNSRLEGTMTIHYPRVLFPLIWLIHLFGGLALWRGVAVQTCVQKRVGMDGKGLAWYRTMNYADGKTDFFSSQMRYLAAHELIETIGFGFGLRLNLTVENGDLVYRSNGHFWQFGKFVINIPDCLLLGTATISEHALSESEFYLDFTMTHPLWGETYSYRGNFNYQSD